MLRLVMNPAAGERVRRFVGDRLSVSVRTQDGKPLPEGWRVLLRTNLGRGRWLRQEIIHSYPAKPPLAGAAWHDIPLFFEGREWRRELTLAEPGYFRAKAHAVDPEGRQHWPEGPDLGVSVHPDCYRTGNTLYCAFVRMFGETRFATSTARPELEETLVALDRQHFTVIPPSGTLRDLVRQFPHIFGTLKCRILQLLPVTPAPTTFARFGRYGSPYAVQDLTAVDPALVDFDKRTTGQEQFRELTREAHRWGGRVLLDIPINHTGWGSTLQENHPEWYLRNERGEFVSPGAWGVTWEDLVELNHCHPALWQNLAEVFLTWCGRGVDGFRCDAGYKIPVEVWRYITARVVEEYPETVFLLEGLGGSWEATEALLTEGGMQCAYSELFQNYTGPQVAWYLDHSLRQSERVGLYAHYSETHDNERLAAKGRPWSLLRNRLCALTSVSGGYGLTCGVEWLATEKFSVHSSGGLRWDAPDNIVPELARLNELLREHPCFHDGAKLRRLSAPDSPVYALCRDAAEGAGSVLVLVNTDPTNPHDLVLELSALKCNAAPGTARDLLGQPTPEWRLRAGGKVEFTLAPAAACCLEMARADSAATAQSRGQPAPQAGKWTVSSYAQARARAAWAVQALCEILPAEEIGPFDWRWLAEWVEEDPARFLGSLWALARPLARKEMRSELEEAGRRDTFPRVVSWHLPDRHRLTPVAQDHWLLVRDVGPFRATLTFEDGAVRHTGSVPVRNGHVACFPPTASAGDATLTLERYGDGPATVTAGLRYLECPATKGLAPLNGLPPLGEPAGAAGAAADGRSPAPPNRPGQTAQRPRPGALVLLTNGRGGMARLCVDLGQVTSKYDCLLGANLHPTAPVDRHVLAKCLRAWVIADGFITALNGENLMSFAPGPPCTWHFLANAGDGRAVEIQLTVWMTQGRNAINLRLFRPVGQPALGRELPDACQVGLTLRVDIEDRNFHFETHRNGGAEAHFAGNCRSLEEARRGGSGGPAADQRPVGFVFSPAADRRLVAMCNRGVYHHEGEWREHIPHPLEATRGLVAEGDAYSPGWFDIPLGKGDTATLVVTAEPVDLRQPEFPVEPPAAQAVVEDDSGQSAPAAAGSGREKVFEQRLRAAARAFLARRGESQTVIAGYPWFLYWGRDTLVAARGLLAMGLREEVAGMLRTFGRWEDHGTLPNTLHGEHAANRDTSDAPLWYGLACEEWVERGGAAADLATAVAAGGKTVADALVSIGKNYAKGTPIGIRMDPDSGLIWSPAHFTWMDTNYPAGTPREGYPVEIQALWIRLLRQLSRLSLPAPAPGWAELAQLAETSFHKLFWLEKNGWLSDVLLAAPGVRAADAVPADCLRPNGLFAITCGLVTGERARRCVAAAQQHLLVPGALRSLAPLPVERPMPIHAPDGRLLNDPLNPYWGRYEGDEDTRRKPAYHNGTAWTWLLPTYCEALARAWEFHPGAVASARACLVSMERLMDEGCLGQIPEILDGDAPHTPRGCDAQAWAVTEALRVCTLLRGEKARP